MRTQTKRYAGRQKNVTGLTITRLQRDHPTYSIEPCPACQWPEADGGYCPACGWSAPVIIGPVNAHR